MSSDVIRRRIEGIPTIHARILTEAEYRQHLARVRVKFFPFTASDSRCTDISDAPPSAVRQLMADWGLATEGEVYALWPAERCGIALYGAQFVDHYDDLWYPSSDDVWIVPSSYSKLINLTHEEEVCLVSPRVSA